MAERRRVSWILLVLGALAVGLVLWVVLHKKPAPKPKATATPVTTAKAQLQDVPVSVMALGSAQAWRSDTILAQVTGKLLSVPFTEGSFVKQGALLAVVDPAPYAAALAQAEGALKRDQALLAEARIDLARYKTLAAQDSIARQTADTQAALVAQDEGTVMVDEGAVAAARINLRYTRITAPIPGRLGVRLVDPGNIVTGNAATTSTTAATASATSGGTGLSASSSGTGSASGIVTINQIEPIAVTFTVPEGDFQRLSDASAGFSKPLATVAMSQETGEILGKGELSIADNKVDPATGMVVLKARFPNADHRLWPGQYVNVQLTLQTLSKVLTLPAGAVNQGPKGAFAFVVGPDGKATVRPLKTGVSQGGITVIQSGVSPGDTVVVDGQMTLRPGAKVRPKPATAGPARPAS